MTYSERRRLGRQEGRRGRDFHLQGAIPAVLLGLLCDDGPEEVHEREFVTAIGGIEGLRPRQRAEHKVGEGLRQGDGAGEVGDGELVQAGGDLHGVCAGEDAVDAEGVELFLLGWVSGGEGLVRDCDGLRGVCGLLVGTDMLRQ